MNRSPIARLLIVDDETALMTALCNTLTTEGYAATGFTSARAALAKLREEQFDLLLTERDLFEIDHCMAGAFLAQDWDFPDELAAAIAAHHDEPSSVGDLDSLIQVSWRLADTLGYAAFSPKRDWSWKELMELVPRSTAAWFGRSPEAAKAEIDQRLASVPQ